MDLCNRCITVSSWMGVDLYFMKKDLQKNKTEKKMMSKLLLLLTALLVAFATVNAVPGPITNISQYYCNTSDCSICYPKSPKVWLLPTWCYTISNSVNYYGVDGCSMDGAATTVRIFQDKNCSIEIRNHSRALGQCLPTGDPKLWFVWLCDYESNWNATIISWETNGYTDPMKDPLVLGSSVASTLTAACLTLVALIFVL